MLSLECLSAKFAVILQHIATLVIASMSESQNSPLQERRG